MALQTGLTTGERFASLFQPDTLIPQEYLETFKRLTHLEPEKRLMFAVLEDGVACFMKYVSARDTRGKKYFRETEEWLLEGPSERLFSFANLCETLGLNADYLRHGLLRWKETALAQQSAGRVYEISERVRGNCERRGRRPQKLITR
jgi:hypothetical protein